MGIEIIFDIGPYNFVAGIKVSVSHSAAKNGACSCPDYGY
jgi:hypothetical protein